MPEEEFKFKFEGEKITGLKVSSKFLIKSIDAITKIAKQITYLDGNERDIDFNIEIREGSTEVVASSISGDELGGSLLAKTAGLLVTDNEESPYSNDSKIKKNIRSFYQNSIDYAEKLSVFKNEEIIGNQIEINQDVINKFSEDTETLIKSPFETHIVLVHKVDAKNMKLGLTFAHPNKFFDVRFNTVLIKRLSHLVNHYILIKIDSKDISERVKGRLHEFEEIPDIGIEIEDVELAGIYDRKIESISSLTDLKDCWDGYNGKKIPIENIDIAKDFMKQIVLLISKLNLNRILPNVVPVPNGNIQFEWNVENKTLEIEFSKGEYQILEILNEDSDEETVNEFFLKKYQDTLNTIFKFLGKKDD